MLLIETQTINPKYWYMGLMRLQKRKEIKKVVTKSWMHLQGQEKIKWASTTKKKKNINPFFSHGALQSEEEDASPFLVQLEILWETKGKDEWTPHRINQHAKHEEKETSGDSNDSAFVGKDKKMQ